MASRPDTVISDLADQHAELDQLLSGLEAADWDRPSRCEGWTVADVVLHLAQTDELAVASITGRYPDGVAAVVEGWAGAGSVDEAANATVALERGKPGAAVHERWRTGAGVLVEELRASDPHARVPWVAGELSIPTLATTRLAEAWIHTGDVAAAFDIVLPATDRLRHIARLAWRTLPYASARDGRTLSGPVALELRSPAGETWEFQPDGATAATVIHGDALDLCLVAARRVEPADTSLHGEGPDAEAVLELIRTYA